MFFFDVLGSMSLKNGPLLPTVVAIKEANFWQLFQFRKANFAGLCKIHLLINLGSQFLKILFFVRKQSATSPLRIHVDFGRLETFTLEQRQRKRVSLSLLFVF